MAYDAMPFMPFATAPRQLTTWHGFSATDYEPELASVAAPGRRTYCSFHAEISEGAISREQDVEAALARRAAHAGGVERHATATMRALPCVDPTGTNLRIQSNVQALLSHRITYKHSYMSCLSLRVGSEDGQLGTDRRPRE